MSMISASTSSRRDTGIGQKLLILAGGFFCFALILIPLLWRPQPQVEESAPQAMTKTITNKKSQQAWNIALGNIVMVAPELGLTMKGPKEFKIESSRLATVIESQLNSLREFYRAENEKQTRVVGAVLVEFTVGEAGRVKHAAEIAARVNNADFRRGVLAEVNKWNFDGVLPEGVSVRCPLLFVREGMEITTLTEWEKQLGLFEEKVSAPAATRASAAPVSATATSTGVSPEADKIAESAHERSAAGVPAREVARGKKTPAKGSTKNRRDASDNDQESRNSSDM